MKSCNQCAVPLPATWSSKRWPICVQCALHLLLAAHHLRFDPPSQKYPRCLVCREPLSRGPGSAICLTPCRSRLRRLTERFADLFGTFAASGHLLPCEPILSDKARVAAHASMRVGRPAAGRVRVPDYLGAAFTYAVVDAVIGDRIAAGLPATSGTADNADGHCADVPGEPRDDGNATEFDGLVDAPERTAPERRPTAPGARVRGDEDAPASVSPTPSVDQSSDVDKLAPVCGSAAPGAPLAGASDGSPADRPVLPQSVPATAAPALVPAPVPGPVDDPSCVVPDVPAAQRAVSDESPPGMPASLPAGTGVRGAVRNLSTTLRHRRLRFTEQSLLLWMWQVG